MCDCKLCTNERIFLRILGVTLEDLLFGLNLPLEIGLFGLRGCSSFNLLLERFDLIVLTLERGLFGLKLLA